jgi:hypothetical protein
MERPIAAQLEQLLATPELAPLGPGPRPGVQAESTLNRALDEVLKTTKLTRERPQLIRSLVLLWHDHLDSAHSIAQSIENADGAFVHGIMHRREPDYGNAAYWFRRVGKHPAFSEIAKQATTALDATDIALPDALVRDGDWEPFAFINACEKATRNSAKATVTLLQELQKIETSVLLGHFAST